MRISDWSSDVCSSDLNWNKQKVNIVRYADDFIITGATKEVLENEVRPMVEEFLAARGLTLSPEKTKITHIDDGFDFLGFNVRKYDGKLLIKPAKKNVSAFLGKVREFVKRSEEHTSELQSLMRISYAVFCLKKKIN